MALYGLVCAKMALSYDIRPFDWNFYLGETWRLWLGCGLLLAGGIYIVVPVLRKLGKAPAGK